MIPIWEVSREGAKVRNANFYLQIEIERRPEVSENCYVCNTELKHCRNPLNTLTVLTQTPLYQILGKFLCQLLRDLLKSSRLESFTGSKFSDVVRNGKFLCHHCLVNLEKYEELQQQCKFIQDNMSSLFHNTHTEQIYIKEEIESSVESADEFEPSPVEATVFFCEECSKSFKTEACMQIHFATNHERNKGEVDCPICFKTYPNHWALRSHYNVHKEKPFLCVR